MHMHVVQGAEFQQAGMAEPEELMEFCEALQCTVPLQLGFVITQEIEQPQDDPNSDLELASYDEDPHTTLQPPNNTRTARQRRRVAALAPLPPSAAIDALDEDTDTDGEAAAAPLANVTNKQVCRICY